MESFTIMDALKIAKYDKSNKIMLKIYYLEHLAYEASAIYSMNANESLWVVRREIGCKNAIRKAFSSEILANRTSS